MSIDWLDASWREDAPMYVPPGGGDYFGRWLLPRPPSRRVIMPVVGWLPHAIRDDRGRWLADSDRHHVVFENARHRTAYMRDHGATALPVLAYYGVAETIAGELRHIGTLHVGAPAFTKYHQASSSSS